MRKLLLGLSVAALGLLALASVAFAEGGSGTASDMLQFRGTDQVSGGEATWVMPWAVQMVDRWGTTYNWRPSQTTTLYFYTDGTMMANDLGTFRGTPLGANDFGYVSEQAGAITTMDTRTNGPGGWAILVNLTAPQFGGAVGVAPYYRNEVKGAITMEFAKLMEMDLTAEHGPEWLRQGFVNYLTETEVPGLNAPIQKYVELSNLVGANAAPTVTALQTSWAGILSTSPQMRDAAIAASTASVRLLIPQIGPQGIINLLNQSATSSDFNALFQSQTGMSLSQFDLAYEAPVQSIIQALNAEMSGQTTP